MAAPANSLLRLTLVPVGAAALVLSFGGCTEDATAPTGLETLQTPAATAAAATAPLVFRMVSAGDSHTCGVTTDNRAWCWGSNFDGQLGDGTETDHIRPVLVAGGLHFRTVSVGSTDTCGVTTDDLAYCWGYGAIGDGSGFATFRRQPVPVTGGHRWQLVRAGFRHTCGITTSGKAYCWGNSEFGQVGNASRQTRLDARGREWESYLALDQPRWTPHLRGHHRLTRVLLGPERRGGARRRHDPLEHRHARSWSAAASPSRTSLQAISIPVP